MKVSAVLAFAVGIGIPDQADGQELHPGLITKRDWSKVSHQFNLKKHLMAPTSRDLRDGIENSRRLARNAAKLGIADDNQRKLIASNPPSGIVALFDDPEIPDPPSDGPRVPVDGTVDALPFGDGPGFFPGFPQGTNEFWLGDGAPQKIWEIVACPVADVEGFLENPLSCVFGYNDAATPTVEGTILDFFATVDATAEILSAMKEAIIPLAVEFVYNFSGLAWLETILRSVCDILGIVDTIVGIVESLGDIGGDFIDTINPANWRRELADTGQGDACNDGHFVTCAGTDPVCKNCLETENLSCSGCRTCFMPLENYIAEMDGLCIDTETLREFVSGPAPNLFKLQSYYQAITANYLKKVAGDDVITSINANVDAAESSINANVYDAETNIKTKVGNTCGRRRLGSPETFEEFIKSDDAGDSQTFEEFIKSDKAQDAREYAAGQGLKEEDVDKIFSKILNDLPKNADDAVNEDLQEEIKKAFSDPVIGKLLDANVKANADAYTGKIVAKILEGATDKKTRRLKGDELKETISKLEGIRKARSIDSRNLGLESDCDAVIDTIKSFIKDDVLTPVLETIVEGIIGLLEGSSNVFDKVKDDPIYSAALVGVDTTINALTMPFGFVKAFDPWGGTMKVVMGAIVDIFQIIVGYFLYGCNVTDQANCSGDLPSLRNQVLPIKQRRNGDIFMGSGCDSEFEGELAFYAPAFAIVDKLLDAAGDAVIEFLNIPIKIIQFVLQAAALLFSHMNDVCGYLDGYVQLALVEGTFENTRFALQELACRNPENGLQRGYGCDGLDNTCDPDKQIDECDEDVFPPEIDASTAIEQCSDKIFDNAAEALACIQTDGFVSAVDDCKEVALTIEDTGDVSPSCSATVLIKAIAIGCQERPEDTSELEVVLDVDGDDPVVECTIGNKHLNGTGAGVFTNLKFDYTAIDGGDECTSPDELAVSIDIYSSEVVETGEEMVSISTPLTAGAIPTIWAEDHVCKTGASGRCKISSPKKSRQYKVVVSATDKAGNTKSAECDTIVGKKQKIIDPNDPLFLIASIATVGNAGE